MLGVESGLFGRHPFTTIELNEKTGKLLTISFQRNGENRQIWEAKGWGLAGQKLGELKLRKTGSQSTENHYRSYQEFSDPPILPLSRRTPSKVVLSLPKP
jgi:hypothetical protein